MSNILWQSSKHLETGDAEPETQPNLLTLYSMRYCPFAHRTRLVLQHKQVPHQIVNMNLVRKPDWFLAKSPGGKVPLLREPDGWTQADSFILSDYLEDAHPESPLYPNDARLRAKIRQSISVMGDLVIPAFFKWVGAVNGSDEQKANWENYLKALAVLQDDLGSSAYFGGCSKVQMADLMIWPWFERLRPACQLLGFELPASRFERLLAWMERMGKERAVMETRIPDEAHEKFLKGYLIDKNPKYDEV